MSKFARKAGQKAARVGVFVDSLNIYCGCRDTWGRVIDHDKLMQAALVGHKRRCAIVYGINFGERMAKWTRAVERAGFEVKTKDPVRNSEGQVKADWDTDIIVDVWRMLHKLDIVVLATGDGDFCTLIARCQKRGKVVRVIGVERVVSKSLKKLVDEFVPVTEDMLLTERRQRNQFGKSLGDALHLAGITPESVE